MSVLTFIKRSREHVPCHRALALGCIAVTLILRTIWGLGTINVVLKWKVQEYTELCGLVIKKWCICRCWFFAGSHICLAYRLAKNRNTPICHLRLVGTSESLTLHSETWSLGSLGKKMEKNVAQYITDYEAFITVYLVNKLSGVC